VVASRAKTEALLFQLRKRGGLADPEDVDRPTTFPLCVSGGRTYAVDKKYQGLVMAVCQDDTSVLCREFMGLPVVSGVGDPLIVSLQQRLGPELKRLLAESVLKWTPVKTPAECNEMVQQIGGTLLRVLANTRLLAPTFVATVHLLSDRRFNPSRSEPVCFGPTLLETVFPESDDSSDSDYSTQKRHHHESTDSDSKCDSEDDEQMERRRARSTLHREAEQRGHEDQQRRREKSYVKRTTAIRDATSAGVLRKERRLAYLSSLMLFQYEPCMSFVPAWAGLMHVCGGTNETVRTMLNYVGVATAVNTSNRHVRLFQGDPMQQARLDAENLTRHLLTEVFDATIAPLYALWRGTKHMNAIPCTHTTHTH
jgi:hypothetical protein